MSGCQTCGGPLPPLKKYGRPRKFCSEPCRKRQYDRVCVDCGGRVDGTYPSRLSDEPRCAACWHAYQRASTYWTGERIIAAIRDWTDRYGEPPVAADWNPWLTYATDEQMVRFRAGHWPHCVTAQQEFGSWNAAIRAAGFEPRGVGKRRHRPRTAA